MAIKKCVCEHKFQDKIYGKDMRVHTPTKKEDNKIYRCTVCGRERR